jgi:hypothetical protein
MCKQMKCARVHICLLNHAFAVVPQHPSHYQHFAVVKVLVTPTISEDDDDDDEAATTADDSRKAFSSTGNGVGSGSTANVFLRISGDEIDEADADADADADSGGGGDGDAYEEGEKRLSLPGLCSYYPPHPPSPP